MNVRMQPSVPSVTVPGTLPTGRFDPVAMRSGVLELQRAMDDWLIRAAPGWDEAMCEVVALVASASVAVVRGIPPARVDALLALAARFGGAIADGNGVPNRLIAEVAPVPGGVLHSQSRAAFPLHTDSAGRERPHAYIVLAVVELDPPPSGALVCTASRLRALLRARPELTDRLRRAEYRFGNLPPVPVLSDGWQIRFRADEATAVTVDASDAIRAFAAALRELEPICGVELEPGDILVVDNRRALHGRTAIPEAQTRRLLRLKVRAGASPRTATSR
jgi:alpha-ketoglutarate-dependent taurine dioxygenase